MEINIDKRLYKRSGNTKLDIVGSSTKPVNITGDVNVTGTVKQTAPFQSVTDPGNGNTITPPANGDFICKLTSGATLETRVLAAPAFVGQRGAIQFETDGGGNVTISNAEGWDDLGVAGDLAVFADAGDSMTIEAHGTSGVTDWRTVSKKGVTLQ